MLHVCKANILKTNYVEIRMPRTLLFQGVALVKQNCGRDLGGGKDKRGQRLEGLSFCTPHPSAVLLPATYWVARLPVVSSGRDVYRSHSAFVVVANNSKAAAPSTGVCTSSQDVVTVVAAAAAACVALLLPLLLLPRLTLNESQSSVCEHCAAQSR